MTGCMYASIFYVAQESRKEFLPYVEISSKPVVWRLKYAMGMIQNSHLENIECQVTKYTSLRYFGTVTETEIEYDYVHQNRCLLNL